MDTSSPVSDIVPFKKEDLFFALVRIYQLMEDIDPDDGTLADTTVDGVDLADLPDDYGEEDDSEDDAPFHFQALIGDTRESLSMYAEDILDEYIGLFALLSTPLEENPSLKKEFQAYARDEHGVDIEFSSFSKKPKLVVVSSKKDDTPAPPRAPDKK